MTSGGEPKRDGQSPHKGKRGGEGRENGQIGKKWERRMGGSQIRKKGLGGFWQIESPWARVVASGEKSQKQVGKGRKVWGEKEG